MNMPQPQKTNWFVLTGRPCSGISTTLAALEAARHATVGEAARAVIDEGIAAGRSVEAIRADDAVFQRDILHRKIENERGLSPGEIVFLDRGIPDSIAYFSMAGMDTAEVRVHSAERIYRAVFFIEPLPYAPDYARTESPEALERLEIELREAYFEFGYDVIHIPVAPVDERVGRILEHVKHMDLPGTGVR
jgi:predicted ATPase